MSVIRNINLINPADEQITSTTNSGKISLDVNLTNPTIKIEDGIKGTPKHLYNEVNAVPVNSSTLVNSYTIPVGKIFDLSKVYFGGDNIAKYTVKINNLPVGSKRTWWTKFDDEFDFIEKLMVANDKIEIFVENRGSDPTTFDATIIGGEYDA